jgi:hypothetical protein
VLGLVHSPSVQGHSHWSRAGSRRCHPENRPTSARCSRASHGIVLASAGTLFCDARKQILRSADNRFAASPSVLPESAYPGAELGRVRSSPNKSCEFCLTTCPQETSDRTRARGPESSCQGHLCRRDCLALGALMAEGYVGRAE